jgi:hypothetical protein
MNNEAGLDQTDSAAAKWALTRAAGNLHRQHQALAVLFGLLGEEFAQLTAREPQSVSRTELSLQELLRQLAREKEDLRAIVLSTWPGARRMRDVLPLLPQESAGVLAAVLAEVDRREQACSVQAEKNTILAGALADQNRKLLEFLHKEIQPVRETYSMRGRPAAGRTQPSILSGRS